MIVLLLLGSLIGFTTTGIREYKDCLKEDFKHPACENGKVLHQIAVKSCEINSKKLNTLTGNCE